MITNINMDISKIESTEVKDKLTIVMQEMHRVLNSTYFRDQVMMMRYKEGERSKYVDYNAKQIYNLIMSGSETRHPTEDYELDIWVDTYYSFRKVIGYTTRGTDTIFINKKYFYERSTKKIGSNILHEYGHKLGFSHDKKATKTRPNSICYQLNKAYEAAYIKLFESQGPITHNKKRVCSRSWKTLWLIKKCHWIYIDEN